MKLVCLLHDLICGALDGPDVRQVAFNELDSALIFAQRDPLPTGPVIFRLQEFIFVPGNDEHLLYAMQKELCSDFCILSFVAISMKSKIYI